MNIYMLLIVKYINIMWLEKTTYHPTLWNADPWVIVPNKLNIPVRQILAHNGPPVMTAPSITAMQGSSPSPPVFAVTNCSYFQFRNTF